MTERHPGSASRLLIAIDNRGEDGLVLRVYLDQNKWIDFSRLRKGRAEAARFETSWTLAREASSRGMASFPLSGIHYMETAHRRDDESRVDLAATMAELSRMHTMAGVSVLIPAEVDAAVASLLDPDGPPTRMPQVFGVGAAHAFGLAPDWVPGRFDSSPLVAAGVPAGVIGQARAAFVDLMEFGLLAHAPTRTGSGGLDPLMREKMAEVSQRFADGQVDLLEQLQAGGNSHRLAEAVSRTDMVDIVHDFNLACLNRGIVPDPSWFVDVEFVEAVLRAVPCKWVVRELRAARLRNPQQRFVRNDLNDVNALSAAVVYCDVVVTERTWAHFFKVTGLGERFGTVVISDLADLAAVLADASVSR